ncbi:MAG: hypothetical protein U0745_08130 [Polyangia bacterium]|jgi:hypothetical protein
MSSAPLPVQFYPKTCPAQFSCPSCQHRAQVVFHDPEAFADDEPIGGRNRWMQDAALEQAKQKLTRRAERAIPLVPCPSCGFVPPSALRKAYLRAALPLVAIVPVVLPTLTMLFGVVLTPSRMSSALLALIATTVLALTVVLSGQRRIVTEARQAVRFDPAQPARTAT